MRESSYHHEGSFAVPRISFCGIWTEHAIEPLIPKDTWLMLTMKCQQHLSLTEVHYRRQHLTWMVAPLVQQLCDRWYICEIRSDCKWWNHVEYPCMVFQYDHNKYQSIFWAAIPDPKVDAPTQNAHQCRGSKLTITRQSKAQARINTTIP